MRSAWRGRPVVHSAFTAAQVVSVVSACKALCTDLGIPHDVLCQDSPLSRRDKQAWVGGILGHMHVSKSGKRDPGTWLLEQVRAGLAL